MPKAKYKLHATKVDRIAIVDRPAVPDAEIVVFKREGEDIKENLETSENPFRNWMTVLIDKAAKQTSGFDRGFVLKGTEAAVDALQDEIWNAIYNDRENMEKLISSAFEDFRSVVKDVAKKIGKLKADSDVEEITFTLDDIVGYIKQGLLATTVSETFAYFRGNLAYMVLGLNSLEEPNATIDKVIDIFKEFITKACTDIVRNKRQEVLEKAGRIISAARLRRLKEAYAVLSEIIGETEERYSAKRRKEADGMDVEKVLEQLKALSESMEGIAKKQDEVVTVLHEKGILLTDEEKKAKEEELAKQKAEEEELAKKEAEEAEKREKEEAEAQEKARKEAEEAEKKAKEEAEERLKSMEESIKSNATLLEAISKRFGVTKKSLDNEDKETSHTKNGDPFGDALRGKK